MMMEGLLRYQHDRTNFRNKVSQALTEASIYGNVPYRVNWKKVVAQVPDYETYVGGLSSMAVTGESPDPLSTKPLLKYEGPYLEIGNIFDYVQDMDADDDESAFRIYRFYKYEDYILKNAEPDPETGFAMFENVEGLTEESRTIESSDSLQNMAQAKLGFQPTQKGGIELLECWGNFPITVDGKRVLLENYVAVIANRSRIIRFEPNPYLHGRAAWRLFRLYEDPGETYGRGDLESVLGLQDALNKRFNQVLDANEITIDPQFVVRTNSVVNIDDLRFAPGGIIEADQVGDIQQLQKLDQSALGMQELGFVMAQFNQSTGAMQGFTTEAYKKSATEIGMAGSAEQQQEAETIKHIEHTFIRPVLEDMVSLNQQLMDQPQMLRIISDGNGVISDPNTGMPVPVGPMDVQVTPEDIAGEFDIKPVGAEWQNMSAQDVAQTIQLIQVMMANGGGQFVKWPQLWSTLASKMGLGDAYTWLKSEQEVMIEQQQQMAMQALQSQMGGSGGPAGPGPVPGGPGQAPGQPGPMGVGSVSGAPQVLPQQAGGPHPGQSSGPSFQA
jgi:hypothetical protein